MKKILLVSCVILPSAVMASPGVVDSYGCHRDPQTNRYHCHEGRARAQQKHILLGLNMSSDLWTYSNGPSSFFGGGGLTVEYAAKSIGAYGELSYKPHLSGNKDFQLSGWSAGLKLGPSIARLGVHPYGTVGVFGEQYTLDNSATYDLMSYQAGMGLIANFQKVALDARVLYRNPKEAQALWASFNAPGLEYHLGFELGAYIRY